MLGFTRRIFASLCNSYFFRRTLSSCVTVPASEYASRRRKLAADIARDVCLKSSTSSKHLIVLPSAELQYMAYHIPYPFLQDSNFLYFTGLKDTIGALILAVTVQPDGNTDSYYTFAEYLFTEVRTSHEELWDGPTMSQSSVSELTGIQFTSSLKELPNFLKHSKNANLWYAPLLERVDDKRPLNKLVLSEVFKIRDAVQNIYNPQPVIDQIRLVKSENEIQCLKLAAAATADCLKHTMKASRPGVSENFIRCTLEYESQIRGFALGYPPVVAGADRANVIHYLRKSEIVEDGDLVLVDVGCRVEGYTADITRTWPINGRFSPIQLVLYEVLVEVIEKCASMATTDRSLNDLHQIMLQELRRHLVNERILPNNDSEALVQKICPHHVGHYLGLDIHDTPTVSYSRRLAPGMILPLEPGIYLRPELVKHGVLKESIGIGMRLEDDFVINKDGRAESLCEDLPRDPSELESIVLLDVRNRSSTEMP